MEQLLFTEGFDLVEGNHWHDNIWGDCSCNKCNGTKGTNYLGKILMTVREENKMVDAIPIDVSPETKTRIAEQTAKTILSQPIDLIAGPINEVKEEENKMENLPVKAFDTETKLISYENPLPPMMCLTTCDAGGLRGTLKTPWEHDIQAEFIAAITAGQHHVGQYTAFDLSILAFQYPDLLPYIFDGLDKGLFHDTLLREKLLN